VAAPPSSPSSSLLQPAATTPIISANAATAAHVFDRPRNCFPFRAETGADLIARRRRLSFNSRLSIEIGPRIPFGRIGARRSPPADASARILRGLQKMIIHLVRHAHAGSRSAWRGDDALRPLSEKGRAQAVAIAGALAPNLGDPSAATGSHGSVLLWSSPYLRCVQTLEPLAERFGSKVSSVDELVEGTSGRAALDHLLAAAEAASVVVACSHGDVIPAVLSTALGRGATLDGELSPRKAARYVIQVDHGAVTHITHVPRPEV